MATVGYLLFDTHCYAGATMEASNSSSPKDTLFVVDDWPMNLEATRSELRKAQKRLERYQAALRLADVEIKRRNRSIIALTTFAYQASHTAIPSDLLKLALVQSLETTNAPVGAILLIDAETKELTLGVHKGLTPELVRILTGQQLDKGATALMPHLVAGAGALLEYTTSDDEAERMLLTISQLTSLVSLSLQIGPRLIGALLVGLQGKRHFTPAELCFLMAMSQETAVALESLRLREGLWLTAEALLGGTASTKLQEVEQNDLSVDVSTPLGLPDITSTIPQPAEDDLEQLLAAMMEAEDEVQQQNADLQTLNTISEMINRTLDLREILQCTVSQTQTTLKTDAAWLYLIDERNQLEMQAHTGLSTDYVRGMQFLKLGKGIEGRVAFENKAHFVESVLKDTQGHTIWVDKEQLQALAAVPITRPGSKSNKETGQTNSNVIGVLATGKRSQAYVWSPREVRLLTSIANQVALAIDNARLYAQVHEGEVGLRAGNQILQEINDMLLEKNANLEGFIQSDLTPALAMATRILHSLLAKDAETLTDRQQKDVATLEKIVGRLHGLARETSAMSQTLDSAFDQVLDSEEKKQDYTGSIRPIRLEKRQDKKSALTNNTKEDDDANPSPTNLEQKSDRSSKPMSFEDAMAAGLVPDNIVDRETKEQD
jgi:GAF domain-containing protein